MANTKKSLIFSALSLLLCCALLAGTTFAWFTDSVTNTGNKIQAGNLEIELQRLQADGSYTSVGEEPVFNYNLWEPGYSDAVVLKISNEGSLALKWNLRLKTASAKANKLGDVIDVYAKTSNGTAITAIPGSLAEAQADGYVRVGTLNELISDPDGAAYGVLYAAGNMPADGYSAAYAGIVLHMREDAGNEYMKQSVGGTFDIILNATQYTYEEDGFGDNGYDEDASLDFVTASNGKRLVNLLEGGNLVILDNDIVYDSTTVTDIDSWRARNMLYGTATLDLSGHKITFNSGEGNKNFALFNVLRKGNLTVKGNGTVDAYASTGGYCFDVYGTKVGSNVFPAVLTIESGTYIGTPSAVQVGAYGTAYIKGGFFDCRPAGNVDEDRYRYTLNCLGDPYKNGTAKIIVTGGTFVNFNPADNQAEGPGTNFVAEGYKVISEEQPDGDVWYTVVPE